MKSSNHPKLKPPPRSLFSCGFFRYCTQSVLSPTNPDPPALPPQPPPRQPQSHSQSESSSSTNTSQSFTQWRFSHTPITTDSCQTDPSPETTHLQHQSLPPPPPPPVIISDLHELFHVAELQFSTGDYSEKMKAIYMLQHSLVNSRAVVNNPRTAVDDGVSVSCSPEVMRVGLDVSGNNSGASQDDGLLLSCSPAVMRGVLGCLKDKELAKPATKVLLALSLGECNRHVAVEEGAVGKVVEALVDLGGSAVAERALAALELLCMVAEGVAEGAAELRAHALVSPMMAEVMTRMETTGGR